ncbi:oxygenase MpaB family protein [Candidatus Palauibacter sp.]|uniref:oxygenase MpaB family protein n=1 Tax=Candidatus Palauibacter sp. TaxID=3101350 RepID=UPI003B01D5D0
MEIPTAYIGGYQIARGRDPEVAEAYIRHTMIGDPLADALVEDLASFGPQEVHSMLATALESSDAARSDMPESLRAFVAEAEAVPDWFDAGIARVASRAFLRNSDIVLAALVGGSIVEGFSTLISKSFRIRGRVADSGVRRLKQNGMQLVEQYLPGGMEPGGDGWRLTLRVRLVHAQSRYLLNQSDEWDHERYGEPISAAHILLAGAAFSGRLMRHVATLGGDFSTEEREAYIHVWRYTGLLMGIPEAILFDDEASACRAFEIGSLCEPPADYDAIIMANSIVNSAPVIIGVTEPAERRKMARVVTQASRELIGDELADTFLFPSRKRKVIPAMRFRHRARRIVQKVLPRVKARGDLDRFTALMDFASFDAAAFSYRLPTALHDEESADW